MDELKEIACKEAVEYFEHFLKSSVVKESLRERVFGKYINHLIETKVISKPEDFVYNESEFGKFLLFTITDALRKHISQEHFTDMQKFYKFLDEGINH